MRNKFSFWNGLIIPFYISTISFVLHWKYLCLVDDIDVRTLSCHLCLSSLSLKPLDVEFMKRLHDKVNIIPLIAKADTLTPDECREFKKTVSWTFISHRIVLHRTGHLLHIAIAKWEYWCFFWIIFLYECIFFYEMIINCSFDSLICYYWWRIWKACAIFLYILIHVYAFYMISRSIEYRTCVP